MKRQKHIGHGLGPGHLGRCLDLGHELVQLVRLEEQRRQARHGRTVPLRTLDGAALAVAPGSPRGAELRVLADVDSHDAVSAAKDAAERAGGVFLASQQHTALLDQIKALKKQLDELDQKRRKDADTICSLRDEIMQMQFEV